LSFQQAEPAAKTFPPPNPFTYSSTDTTNSIKLCGHSYLRSGPNFINLKHLSSSMTALSVVNAIRMVDNVGSSSATVTAGACAKERTTASILADSLEVTCVKAIDYCSSCVAIIVCVSATASSMDS